VYPIPGPIALAGVSPVMGLRTEIFIKVEIVLGAAGKTAVITPELAELLTEVAPSIVKKSALTPVNV
jgi:hypothetical protein